MESKPATETKIYLNNAIIGKSYRDANYKINYERLLRIEERYLGGESTF